MRVDRFERDPAGFIDAFIRRTEKNEPWTLSTHQRRVLALAIRFDADGVLLLRLLLWGELKKSGKTFTAACLLLWWAFTRPRTEIVCLANDLEQSTGRVFATAVALCEHNPELRRSVKILNAAIRVSNGTTIRAVASDYRGEAGARQSLAVFDELWGYATERAERLFEEMTPPPTERNAWILIVTTAGFTGESKLLERLYQRGLTGRRLDADLELTAADDLTMFWAHTPRQPWQTPAYYAEQQRLLRPATFARLHRNEWTTSESAFITADLWDACVDPARAPLLTSPTLAVYGGADGSVSGDTASTQFVAWEGERLVHVRGMIWRPTKASPLDIEQTLEADIRATHGRFRLRALYADPYQLHRSLTTLKAAGIAVEPFAQTQASTAKMGGSLFELLKTRGLVLYPDADLRQQALNTAGIESAYGVRITKQTGARKIDGIAALAMACVAALAAGPVVRRPNEVLFTNGASDAILDDPEVQMFIRQLAETEP